ncbi:MULTISPECIES: hypothetical protein [Acidiphilium]|uniref:hypothetical protein n=1 Tax=Acidiphilium TaxID=522 RepID=UPI0011154E0D|nr:MULTISPECIES: hypothetical protein [Acidiphilium]
MLGIGEVKADRKTSFFEKKEAKKLRSSVPVPLKPPVAQINKSFLLLFYKKEVLPSVDWLSL